MTERRLETGSNPQAVAGLPDPCSRARMSGISPSAGFRSVRCGISCQSSWGTEMVAGSGTGVLQP